MGAMTQSIKVDQDGSGGSACVRCIAQPAAMKGLKLRPFGNSIHGRDAALTAIVCASKGWKVEKGSQRTDNIVLYMKPNKIDKFATCAQPNRQSHCLAAGRNWQQLAAAVSSTSTKGTWVHTYVSHQQYACASFLRLALSLLCCAHPPAVSGLPSNRPVRCRLSQRSSGTLCGWISLIRCIRARYHHLVTVTLHFAGVQ